MTIKEKFIQDLIKELNNINYHEVIKYEGNKTPIDVPYVISVIDQQIENYKEFMDDITNYTYYINNYERDNTEGYTNGKIKILIENTENDTCYYYYFIEFLYDQRHWGYCQCTPEDKDYNSKYDCCGNGCDFVAPAFRLIKKLDFGYSVWEGREKDYWTYKEQFEANEQNKNTDVEKFRNEQKKQELENRIKKLQVELEVLR